MRNYGPAGRERETFVHSIQWVKKKQDKEFYRENKKKTRLKQNEKRLEKYPVIE